MFAAAFVLVAAAVTVAFSNDDTFQGAVVKKPFDPAIHGKEAKTNSTQILYHNGPVAHPVSVYYIYYGAVNSSVQTIMNNFLVDLNGQPPYQVNTWYWDTTPQPFPWTGVGGLQLQPTCLFDEYRCLGQLGLP